MDLPTCWQTREELQENAKKLLPRCSPPKYQYHPVHIEKEAGSLTAIPQAPTAEPTTYEPKYIAPEPPKAVKTKKSEKSEKQERPEKDKVERLYYEDEEEITFA